MGTVRDRLGSRVLGGGVALLGILLVVPSVVSPTRQMSVADREHGSLLSRQWEWSWGRVRVTGLEGVELRDQWNPIGLTVLVALLAAGLVGVAAWGLRRVPWGRLLGLVTVGLLAGRELTTVSSRLGQSLAEVDQGAAGLTIRTEMTSAGSLETAAAVVLLVAVALMVTAAASGAGRTGGARDEAPSSGPAPLATRPGAAGLRPAGEHLTSAPVSFDETRAVGQADSTERTPAPGPPGRTGGRS